MQMNSEYVNTWLENFERQIMIRKAIVLSGNTVDLSFDSLNQLKPVKSIIEETLKRKGYSHVIFYSRITGVSGISQND